MAGTHETCEYGGDPFDGRAEYCTEPGPESVGPVIAVLEELLDQHEAGGVTRDGYDFTLADGGNITEFTTSYLFGDRYPAWMPAEAQVYICHMAHRLSGEETYGVAICLQEVEDELKTGERLGQCVARYTIETSPRYSVDGQIEQPGFDDGPYENRPMTPYDYRILLAELKAIRDLNAVELAHNLLSE